ncbi:hypothetical protein [Streptomyces chryseus]|uniref:hypothetical protein n=1 Tax=Streptomyces chryseus TaxID=68186 RepID=UPI00142EF67D|nr:hypothetical protein [Streptomyces chryseus]GGX26556.1 hypothetical protein GCM10010353_46990 [Streptomyces chryseus]
MSKADDLLATIRDAVERFNKPGLVAEEACRPATDAVAAFEELDEWLSAGNPPPEQWK